MSSKIEGWAHQLLLVICGALVVRVVKAIGESSRIHQEKVDRGGGTSLVAAVAVAIDGGPLA